ncbi:MAG: hypothetical protein ACRDSF_00545 [Pseudonocardiaceae bacterium]
MRRFRITRSYKAVRDGTQYGPWESGHQVELDDDVAAWIQRDSPGLLMDLGCNAGERVDDDPHRETERPSSSKSGKTR